MACHDGSAARDIGSHGLAGTRPQSGTEHPIGVLYGPKRSPGAEVRLLDRSRLDPTIRLFDRSIGCGSCHSVYSGSERLLVKPNTRSALCLSCHVE
jgi:predicted CXXCH cytochrome family protein